MGLVSCMLQLAVHLFQRLVLLLDRVERLHPGVQGAQYVSVQSLLEKTYLLVPQHAVEVATNSVDITWSPNERNCVIAGSFAKLLAPLI